MHGSFIEDLEELARHHDFTGPISDRTSLKSQGYQMRYPKKVAKRMRAWRKRNRDRLRLEARQRKKREPTPEQRKAIREYNRKWIKRHPEVRRIIYNRRRARLKGNSHTPFTRVQWLEKVASYGGGCAYCDTGRYEHMDHVVAIARGGPHSLDNIVPACKSCNDKKGVQIWTPRKPIVIALANSIKQ